MISKKTRLKKLKSKTYQIYGIFNFRTEELVYVNMDVEQTELEFDLSDYDPEEYDIVSFEIMLV